jgi:hypothetical protein
LQTPVRNRIIVLIFGPENVTVKMPTKKPNGRQLTDEQKSENKEISSFRIIVEHAIG